MPVSERDWLERRLAEREEDVRRHHRELAAAEKDCAWLRGTLDGLRARERERTADQTTEGR